MNTAQKNSENYINKKVDKKHGFKVPKNYFETVEDDFFVKLNESSFPKEAGFSIPKGYFDSLEDTILTKLETTKKPTKVISLRSKVIRFAPFAAAASILLFIGMNYFTFSPNTNIDNIAITEVEKWVQNNINTINNDDLSIAFEASDFNETELISSSINNDEIEEYLQTVETSSILNELK